MLFCCTFSMLLKFMSSSLLQVIQYFISMIFGPADLAVSEHSFSSTSRSPLISIAMHFEILTLWSPKWAVFRSQ